MRLADLNPEFRGTPTSGIYDISLDCPRCGRPQRVMFKGRLNCDPSGDGVWSFHAKFTPVIDWNSVTIKPSVSFTSGMAHGRRHPCSVHFSIINGEVTLS